MKVFAARSTCSGMPPASRRSRSITRRSICSFPSGCTSLTADGRLQSVTEAQHPVRRDGRRGQAASGRRQGHALPEEREGADGSLSRWSTTFDPVSNQWNPELPPSSWPIPRRGSAFASELMTFLATDQYKGTDARHRRPFPRAHAATTTRWCRNSIATCTRKGLKLYIAVPVNDRRL